MAKRLLAESTSPLARPEVWSGSRLRKVSLAACEPFIRGENSGWILHPPLRDRARTGQKVLRAYANDASRACDIVRAAVVVDDLDEAYETLALLDASVEIVGLVDRFKEPSATGYRDMLVHVRMPNGHVCAVQIQGYLDLKARADAHPVYIEIQTIGMRARARANRHRGCGVLIVDLFNYQLEREEFLIDGFADFSRARQFARRWVRDSVEEFRCEGRSPEEQSLLWTVFGEDAVAIELEGDEPAFAGSSELALFLERPARRAERDWLRLLPGD